MMLLKKWINTLMGVTGYQMTRRPSLLRDIALGKYRWLQEKKIATVLDVGANTGQFAEMIRHIFPQAMIYSFEPLESCYRELAAKASSLAPMYCFHTALGKEDSVMTIHRSDFSASSSILPMGIRHFEAFPHTGHSVEEKIRVRSMDSVAPELLMRSAILAKVDVQGYELNVLAGAEKTLPLIDVLIVETSFVELYEEQPLFPDVYQFLSDHRFSFVGCFDQVHDPTNGAVLQADSIFLNTQRE